MKLNKLTIRNPIYGLEKESVDERIDRGELTEITDMPAWHPTAHAIVNKLFSR